MANGENGVTPVKDTDSAIDETNNILTSFEAEQDSNGTEITITFKNISYALTSEDVTVQLTYEKKSVTRRVNVEFRFDDEEDAENDSESEESTESAVGTETEEDAESGERTGTITLLDAELDPDIEYTISIEIEGYEMMAVTLNTSESADADQDAESGEEDTSEDDTQSTDEEPAEEETNESDEEEESAEEETDEEEEPADTLLEDAEEESDETESLLTGAGTNDIGFTVPKFLVGGLVGFLIGMVLTAAFFLAYIRSQERKRREKRRKRREQGRGQNGGQGSAASAGASATADNIARTQLQSQPGSDSRGLEIFVGKVHEIGARDSQQDSFAISEPEAMPEKGFLAVVADGMGGLADGDKVSQTAIAAIMENFYSVNGEPSQILLHLLERANEAVNRMLGPNGLSKSGSTLVMALIRDRKFYYLSVGDSRIALLRGGVLYQLNRDHVYRNDLSINAVNGQTTLLVAAQHPKAAGLTSYLGMGTLKYVDIPAQPMELQAGDRFVLMSDGVYNALTADELKANLSFPAQDAANALRAAIQAKNYRTQDNYTAVILEIREV